jgi:hypothetical protein
MSGGAAKYPVRGVPNHPLDECPIASIPDISDYPLRAMARFATPEPKHRLGRLP